MTCSGVPLPLMPAAASAEPMIAMPMPASPQNSSSIATRQREAGRVAEQAFTMNSKP